MAVISSDTFDPLRRYIGVRLQQGVPIVDADWNELEDVRKFELRAFLKWFVGNGVPEGNDGFRIMGTGAANDFTIGAGITPPADGLGNVGRCLVDGLDVIIQDNIFFSAQELHAGRAGSAALAAALGVPVIQAMTTPGADGTVVAYLDVWERLVTPAEDPLLVHPGLGTESCARLKREWVVRVRGGTAAPVAGDADYLAGHGYYALASITRRAGIDIVNAFDVVDVREQRLVMLPATLVEDLFGAVDYRRGRGRPPISYREAINAILRGDVPGPPEASIAPAPGSDDDLGRGIFFDRVGGLVITWNSNRAGGIGQVFRSRLSLANPNAGFIPVAQQITAGPTAHTRPHAVSLNTGEALVVYESATGPGNEDIHLKRGTYGALNPGLAEIPVAIDAGIRQRAPFAVVTGGQVLILWHESPGDTWQLNRFSLASSTFPNPKQALSAATASAPGAFDLHAARDSTNRTWVAFKTSGNNIRTQSVPLIGPPAAGEEHDSGSPDILPHVLVDKDDNVWVFWSSVVGAANITIRYRQFVQATGTWIPGLASPPALVTGTDVAQNVAPAAVTDADGGIWLFFHSTRSGSGNQDIWYIRLNPVTHTWGVPRQITGASEADTNPFTLQGENGVIWLFWKRQIAANGELFHRRVVTSI